MAQAVVEGITTERMELSKALEHVEAILAEVLSSIQKLNDESQQAKQEITEAFGRQMTHLHSRETQLLRQVDVIFRARGEMLQKQLAYCYRLLGALETSQKWTEQLEKYPCEVALSGNGDIEAIKKWVASNPLQWTLNEEALNHAIANFGKVEMDGALLLHSGEQSKCLPARVEEYIEDDNQVWNKPLNSSTSVINIKFPKLPKDYSYWLSRPVSHQQEEKSDSSYGPYRNGADSYKACDVQTWLGCIQNEIAAEPMDDTAQSIPDGINTISDSGSVDSKDSDSIEIIQMPNTNLCKNYSPSMSVNSICNIALGNVEIENLADTFSACLNTNDKQRWLVSNSKTDIPIAKACRANSVCESFELCVCDTNCLDVARKNRDEKTKQNDYYYWLRPASPPTSTKSTTNNKPQFPSIFSSTEGDYSKWLHPSSLDETNKAQQHHITSNQDFLQLLTTPSITGSSKNSNDGTTSAHLATSAWLLNVQESKRRHVALAAATESWLLAPSDNRLDSYCLKPFAKEISKSFR